MKQTVIGRVYVKDEDDWDQVDKVYSWAGSKPQEFDLDQNGFLTIKEGVPAGTYTLKVCC